MQRERPIASSDEASALLRHADDLVEVAKTASRGRKSLSGDNFYGHKFHDAVVQAKGALARLIKRLEGVPNSAGLISSTRTHVDALCSTGHAQSGRNSELKQLKLLVVTEIKPLIDGMIASPYPATEQVLPRAVVSNTRSYFEKVICQANGCYEHQWFDACSVMVRRFVETLIVELYEAKGKATDIQDANGDFLMLQKLIEVTLADSAWNLSRETKRTLPLVKRIGDRAAHNRRYVATKKDVDEIIPGLRVVADDLLHLAGIK